MVQRPVSGDAGTGEKQENPLGGPRCHHRFLRGRRPHLAKSKQQHHERLDSGHVGCGLPGADQHTTGSRATRLDSCDDGAGHDSSNHYSSNHDSGGRHCGRHHLGLDHGSTDHDDRRANHNGGGPGRYRESAALP